MKLKTCIDLTTAFSLLATSQLLFGLTAAAAEMTVETAVKNLQLKDRETMQYVSGISHGIEWANAELGGRRGPPHFCAPPNLAITSEQYFDILRRWFERNPGDARAPVGFALLKAAQETFPCAKNQRTE